MNGPVVVYKAFQCHGRSQQQTRSTQSPKAAQRQRFCINRRGRKEWQGGNWLALSFQWGKKNYHHHQQLQQEQIHWSKTFTKLGTAVNSVEQLWILQLTSDNIVWGVKRITQNILNVFSWTISSHLQTSFLSSNKVNKMIVHFVKMWISIAYFELLLFPMIYCYGIMSYNTCGQPLALI